MGIKDQPKSYCLGATSAMATGGVLLLPVSNAYAISVDEIVETVSSSTPLTFGAGAAAGAIVAGTVTIIIISVTSRGRRRRERKHARDLRDAQDELKFARERIRVLKQTVIRQEEALDQEKARYRAYVSSVQTAMDERKAEVIEPEEFEGPEETVVMPKAQQKGAAPRSQKVEEPQADVDWQVEATVVAEPLDDARPADPQDTGASVKSMLDDRIPLDSLEFEVGNAEEALTGILETDTTGPILEDEYAILDEAYDVAKRVEEDMPTGKNVRLVLDERLTPDAFTGVGTYRRVGVRATDIPAFLSRRRARQYDPNVRASMIDERVPRFDESLFPEALRPVHDEVDIFDTAMRAMEDTLQHTAVLGIEEEEDVVYLHPEDRPEIVDAAAYVDYLMKDELEKTNGGNELPSSRAHLNRAQGFADITGSRKRSKYSPRHMRVAS